MQLFKCGEYSMKNFPIYAEEDRGYSWTRMSNIAKINNIYLIAGTMPEKDSENHIYNTSYVFNRDGEQIAKHRKMHLFDIRAFFITVSNTPKS